MDLKYDFSDGDVLYSKTTSDPDGLNGITNEVNLKGKIHQVYTGTGFNTSTTTTAEASQELTLIPASALTGDYLIIECLYDAYIDRSVTANKSSNIEFKIQTKENGGAYADSLAYKSILFEYASGDGGPGIRNTSTIKYYHTLTANEKTSGIYIKIFSKCTNVATTNTISFTNIQTVIKNP